MKSVFIAAFLFVVPIVGVIAMDPDGAKQSVEQGVEWAKKTFPKPEPKPKPVRRG